MNEVLKTDRRQKHSKRVYEDAAQTSFRLVEA
jgi:hypothetical protein